MIHLFLMSVRGDDMFPCCTNQYSNRGKKHVHMLYQLAFLCFTDRKHMVLTENLTILSFLKDIWITEVIDGQDYASLVL